MAARTKDREMSGDQCVVMRWIGWKGYQHVLRARGERSIPRMVYLDGNLSLESFSYGHERLSGRLSMLVLEVTTTLNIPCTPAGSTTFFLKRKRAGVEGDQTYYLANEPKIRHNTDLDLRVDPPPDLAIEIAYAFNAGNSVEAWRRFRVPEIWVEDGDKLTIFALQSNRRLAEVETSVTFPFLNAAEIHAWVVRKVDGSDTDWALAVRRWVEETIAPRVKSQPPSES